MAEVIAFPTIDRGFECELPLAAGAEQLSFRYITPIEEERGLASVVPLPSLESTDQAPLLKVQTFGALRLSEREADEKTLERHEKWLGSLALDTTVMSAEIELKPEFTLAEAIRKARIGNKEHMPLIEMNVATATGENFEKVAYVRDVELEETENGEIIQFGQTVSQIHQNTIRYCDWEQPEMQQRTVIESLSAFRTEDGVRDALTDTHWLIDISLVPDLPDDQLEDLNFFPRTKTGIIRGFTRQDDGKLIWRSAFFAGVADEDSERHDVDAVRAVLVESFGIEEAKEWDINQILESVVAIPKSQAPNGPVDIVPVLDDKIEQQTGIEVYWGQRGSRGDYESVISESKKRDEKRQDLQQKIVMELIQSDSSFSHPVDAVDMLQKLVEKHGTVEVIEDESYPVWLFGERAQVDIEQARMYRQEIHTLEIAGQAMQAQQMMQRFQLATQRAQSAAKGGGCPSSRRKQAGMIDELGEVDPAGEGVSFDKDGEEDEYGSLDFECTEGCKNRRPRGKLITECKNASRGCKGKVAC